MRLTVLGARGSVPVSGAGFVRYGGDTSCYMVEAGEYAIFLDAGSGILRAPKISEKSNIIILLSHPHIDHLIGLPLFDEMTNKNRSITVYGRRIRDISTEDQIRGLFDRMYWPVTPWEISEHFECMDTEYPLIIQTGPDKAKDIVIEATNLTHPGGSIGYRIGFEGKSIVYMTDCELNEAGIERLAAFAEDSDLLLCDAQYTSKEYETRHGFGHSTKEAAIELMKKSGSKRLLMIHHDPHHTDEQIEEMEKSINDERISFARSGMQIQI
jgi:phosphoribosyl 1,2-cyclic phosphodiesterase